MRRHTMAGRLIRGLLVVLSGAVVLDTGTSCGDQIRQGMLSAATDAINTTSNQLLTDAVDSLLSNVLGNQT